MKCPICSDENLVMTDRQGIEIDYCPKCRGVWLDRGELDKIIERNLSAPQAKTSEAYREPEKRYDNHGHHKKKKGGLLSELFDF